MVSPGRSGDDCYLAGHAEIAGGQPVQRLNSTVLIGECRRAMGDAA
jgi:hypothetical protein